jgi:hypothetical protein
MPLLGAPAGDALKHYWSLAAVAALLVCCVYLALIVSIDNTNLGTTNGLWKSSAVSAWEHGGEGPVDSGGLLYAQTYGRLAGLIPDRWVRYGTTPPQATFRKMALLNGVFGALAAGFVYLFALRITNSRLAAGLIVLAHSGAAFILLNSLNSEDIIPAYAFFMGASIALFEFLYSGKIWLCVVSAVLFALATLFHWTTMAPGLAAYGAVFLLASRKNKVYLAIGAGWLLLFLCATEALVLLAFPKLHIPIWAIVLPAKANAGGWVGFHLEKMVFLLVGIGNYFSGGRNLASYRDAFHGGVLDSMVVSWIYGLVTAGGCITTLLDKKAGAGLKFVAVFAAGLFFAGEAGDLYSQPQDPQMQVQPMFASIAGLSLLASRYPTGRRARRRAVALVSGVLFLSNASWNLHLLAAGAAGDSRSVALIQDLDRAFPRHSTAIVCLGFEDWVTWQSVLEWPNDTEAFLQRSFHLTGPFTMNRGISGRDAATLMRRQIDTALASGLRVVANSLWTEQPERFIGSLLTVTGEGEARVYDSLLRNSYRLGQRWQTPAGPFVEILPNGP